MAADQKIVRTGKKNNSSDGMVKGNTLFGSLLKIFAFIIAIVGGIIGLQVASTPMSFGVTQNPTWTLAYPIWGATLGIFIVLFWMGEVLMLLYHQREFMWLNDNNQDED